MKKVLKVGLIILVLSLLVMKLVVEHIGKKEEIVFPHLSKKMRLTGILRLWNWSIEPKDIDYAFDDDLTTGTSEGLSKPGVESVASFQWPYMQVIKEVKVKLGIRKASDEYPTPAVVHIRIIPDGLVECCGCGGQINSTKEYICEITMDVHRNASSVDIVVIRNSPPTFLRIYELEVYA